MSQTPGPRLPIEPGDRPLYRLGPRIGCSPVSAVSVVALLAFVFFFFRVAPGVVEAVQDFSLPRVLGVGGEIEEIDPTTTVTVVATPTSDEPPLGIAITPEPLPTRTPTTEIVPTATPFPTTGPAILETATSTPPPPPTATNTPEPSPTPAAEYVKIGNTEGTGVYLRAEPKRDAQRLAALPDNTVLLVVGENVQSENMEWRQVQTTSGDILTGFILTIYLQPTNPP